jgi:hypothetical protein
MRTLLCAFLALFLPARGHRRGTPAPVRRPSPRIPAYRVATTAPHHLPGEEIALIRPYYQRWADAGPEEREAILRRNRRMDAAEVAAV